MYLSVVNFLQIYFFCYKQRLLLGSPQVSKREDTVHSAGPEAEREMERILQQTQASLMKAIPDLELSSQVDSALSQTPILPDEVDSPLPVSPLPGMSVHSCVSAYKPFIQIVGHK